MHDLGLEVLGGSLKCSKLLRRNRDVNNLARRWLALPHIKLQLVHHLLELGCVGGSIDTEDLPVIIADLLLVRDRRSRGKPQRGEGNAEKLHVEEQPSCLRRVAGEDNDGCSKS